MSIARPDMVRIPAGVFLMGSDLGRDDEHPPHEVELPDFFIGRFSVTNGEYARFLRDTSVPPPPSWTDPAFSHPGQPVVAVSWHDAVAYCEWLGGLLGESCRLPTEAEREYACRAGTRTAFPWGDDPERSLSGYGDRWYRGGPEIVGGPPNGFGLCNMGDNVHEWCADWYDRDYYRVSPRFDPRGPDRSERRASRGGSWRHAIKVTRSAARSALDPSYRYTDYGFRLALPVS